jgi:hypothetical protein
MRLEKNKAMATILHKLKRGIRKFCETVTRGDEEGKF